MTQPFFDDAARSLFDEILAESIVEFRAEKERVAEDVPATPEEPPQQPQETPAEDPWPVTPKSPQQRLHRAMYVLDMHKGRPHANKPAFQRRWLEEALRAIVLMLADLPEDDTT